MMTLIFQSFMCRKGFSWCFEGTYCHHLQGNNAVQVDAEVISRKECVSYISSIPSCQLLQFSPKPDSVTLKMTAGCSPETFN